MTDIDDKFLADLQGNDELGVVIRAHIHIESLLARFYEAYLSAEELTKAGLEYNQKVHIATACGLSKRFSAPLICLGKIRNNFAHKPEASLGEQEVNNFYSAFAGTDKDIINKAYTATESKYVTDGKKFGDLEPRDRFILMAVNLRAMLLAAIDA